MAKRENYLQFGVVRERERKSYLIITIIKEYKRDFHYDLPIYLFFFFLSFFSFFNLNVHSCDDFIKKMIIKQERLKKKNH